MFQKLENGEIDIVIVKKYNKANSNTKYIKLGDLEDIFICGNKVSFGKHKELKLLDNKILYIPRNNSSSLEKVLEVLEKNNIKPIIKRVDSTTMVKLVKDSSNIGFITKEYLREELEKEEIKELQLDINIPKSEFGIYYIEENKFKELNDLIKIIKHNF